jgi:hypothetical protein
MIATVLCVIHLASSASSHAAESCALSTEHGAQDVLVEMNDGVREVRAGKVGVRVEMRTNGDDRSELPIVRAGAPTRASLDQWSKGGHARAWV